ncbi:DUF998 domain-containing protein [Mycolicibacterium vaccae]|uniref:DUF998 domain-containing protein n=1 Tax=Mycolicibacterium vaccae TaxID=1810 RepID=UPI003CF773F6
MASARTAAVIWILGATAYLVCEAVAAAGLPGYGYSADYISDLGVSDVMNVGAFMVHGILFGIAAVVLARGCATTAARVFLVAAVANTVGNILVGTFHSGTPDARWHVVGAGLAIVGGNVAVIAAGFAGRALQAPSWARRASFALGTFGLVCLITLIIDGANGSRVFPAGLVERGSVYPIIAWELLAGLTFLRRR